MVRMRRDPGVIQLKLLGGVALAGADGQPLQALLAQPRRLALLAMLALESVDGDCPRARLMATFWPGLPPDRAATNLRQALAFLRGILGPGAIVAQGRHALRLQHERVRCDAVEALAGRAPAAATLLMAGFQLRQDDEAWEDWLAEQRERLAPAAPQGAPAPQLPSDPEAQADYLQGRFHWTRRPRESFKALAALERAVQRAPDFAPAHAALADVYNTLGSWESGALSPRDAFPKAHAAARRALQLDPCCAAAHTALAYATAHYDWRWDLAGAQFAQALAIDPGYAHAHHWQAHWLVAQGRFSEALAAGRRALALQPADVIIHVHLAWHHWIAREPLAAIAQAERTAYLDETDHWPPFFRGLACVQCGRSDEAVGALRESCALSRGNAVMRAGLGYVYAAVGDCRSARAVLSEFDEAAERQQRFAYEAAVIRAALGEADAAFERLIAAVAGRSAWIAYLGVDPRLDPLRGDPRFEALAARAGLG
jgi:Flp pilus assembly protein TadD